MGNPLVEILVPLVVGAAAVIWLLPSARKKPRLIAGILGVISMFLLSRLTHSSGSIERDVMFDVFAAVALVSGAMMVTDKSPAYAALWFALVTLAVCGLFFLQSAPFLAAASVIVYAGAIIVTFLFVLMLASQSGGSSYDQHPSHGVYATVAAFTLLGIMIGSVHRWSPDTNAEAISGQVLAKGEIGFANPLSRTNDKPTGSLHELGRSLFGDYLYAVELAGTLLLVATIGAIAIAPRRSQGTL